VATSLARRARPIVGDYFFFFFAGFAAFAGFLAARLDRSASAQKLGQTQLAQLRGRKLYKLCLTQLRCAARGDIATIAPSSGKQVFGMGSQSAIPRNAFGRPDDEITSDFKIPEPGGDQRTRPRSSRSTSRRGARP
jgi:hypothetical protein